MATYIKNDADLRKFIQQMSKSMKAPLKKALDEVAEIVRDMWKAHLKEYWYDVYLFPENLSEGDRTMETIESIVKTEVVEHQGQLRVFIHYDTDLINRYTNWHHNPDAMPYIVEDGDGLTRGHPQASHAMKRTVEWMEQKNVFENTIRKALEARGIDIQVF